MGYSFKWQHTCGGCWALLWLIAKAKNTPSSSVFLEWYRIVKGWSICLQRRDALTRRLKLITSVCINWSRVAFSSVLKLFSEGTFKVTKDRMVKRRTASSMVLLTVRHKLDRSRKWRALSPSQILSSCMRSFVIESQESLIKSLEHTGCRVIDTEVNVEYGTVIFEQGHLSVLAYKSCRRLYTDNEGWLTLTFVIWVLSELNRTRMTTEP